MKRSFLPISSAIVAAVLATSSIANAQQWRLSKTEFYSADPAAAPYEIVDMVKYHYSDARGSSAPWNDDIWFDKEEWYSNVVNQPTLVTSYTTRQYNSNNDITEEIDYSYDMNTSSLQPDYKTEMLYNGNVLDSTIYYSYNTTQQQYEFNSSEKDTYNGSGMIEVVKRYDDMNVLDEIEYFTYDANGNILIDSIVSYTTGTPKPMSILYYTYDGAGNNTQWTHVNYYTGSRVVGGNNYYYYDANGLLLGDSSNTDPNGYTVRSTYTYDAQNRMASATRNFIIMTGGTITSADSTITDYSYNTHGYIDAAVAHTYYSGAGTGQMRDSIQYYYSPYFPVNANSVAKQTAELVAYPVPSSDFIHLKWETEKPTAINARIVNMHGQVVRQWNDNADGAYYKSINVANLSAGNYYIVIAANGKQIEKKITVIK